MSQALELDSKYVKAWAKKGDIEFFMKEYHKALDSYKMVGVVVTFHGHGPNPKSIRKLLQESNPSLSLLALGPSPTLERKCFNLMPDPFSLFSWLQGLTVEPNNSLCVDGVRKTTVKINEVCIEH